MRCEGRHVNQSTGEFNWRDIDPPWESFAKLLEDFANQETTLEIEATAFCFKCRADVVRKRFSLL